MKLGEENKTSGGHLIGYAFGWPGEYSLAGVYLDEVDYGDDAHDGSYSEAWVETDQDSYAGVIETAMHDKILVDVFQNQPCCDLFLCYLKQWLKDNEVEDCYKKQLEDWYFSEKPSYKVI